MKNEKYQKESFTLIVLNSNNLTDVAKNLGLVAYCGNRNTIKKYIKLYDIDVSHFNIDNTKKRVVKKLIYLKYW